MPREIMKRQGDEASMSTQPGRKERQQQLTEAETTAPGMVEKRAKAAETMS